MKNHLQHCSVFGPADVVSLLLQLLAKIDEPKEIEMAERLTRVDNR